MNVVVMAAFMTEVKYRNDDSDTIVDYSIDLSNNNDGVDGDNDDVDYDIHDVYDDNDDDISDVGDDVDVYEEGDDVHVTRM